MHFSHDVSIPAPESSINLPDWLFGLTEEDYDACARGHRAIGTVGNTQRLGMVNVESIGGSLLVQHYATRRAERNHVTMVSKASRAYMMHMVPVKIGVKWDMRVVADSPKSSRFHCELDVDMPVMVRLLGLTIGTPFFIRQHLVEETVGFARDIASKIAAENTDARRS